MQADADDGTAKGQALLPRHQRVIAGSLPLGKMDHVELVVFLEPFVRFKRAPQGQRGIHRRCFDRRQRHQRQAVAPVFLDPLLKAARGGMGRLDEETSHMVSGGGESMGQAGVGGADAAVANRPDEIGTGNANAQSAGFGGMGRRGQRRAKARFIGASRIGHDRFPFWTKNVRVLRPHGALFWLVDRSQAVSCASYSKPCRFIVSIQYSVVWQLTW